MILHKLDFKNDMSFDIEILLDTYSLKYVKIVEERVCHPEEYNNRKTTWKVIRTNSSVVIKYLPFFVSYSFTHIDFE